MCILLYTYTYTTPVVPYIVYKYLHITLIHVCSSINQQPLTFSTILTLPLSLPHFTIFLPIGPWFVAAKDAERNILYVTNNLTAIDKPRKEFRIHRMNWVSGNPPVGLTPPTPTTLSPALVVNADTDTKSRGESDRDRLSNIGMILHLKLRHGTTFSRGIVKYESSIVHKVEEGSAIGSERGSESGGVDAVYSVVLDERDKGIAPGQYAALYETEGGVCLGAGAIYDTSSD